MGVARHSLIGHLLDICIQIAICIQIKSIDFFFLKCEYHLMEY